jgi:hypothetical protein
MSNSSEEKLRHTSLQSPGFDQDCGITVTREVEVSYQAHDAPFVHAALVGLRQGEIMKRKPSRSL